MGSSRVTTMAIVALVAFSATMACAQPEMGMKALSLDTADAAPPPMKLTGSAIINSFVKTEMKVREAMNQYTFKREVVLQTIGPGGRVTGEYLRDSEFVFDDQGNRIERVTYHPPSTIREMRITREDIQDLAGAQLLGIDILESAKYVLSFVGEATVDGRQVYAISVEPTIPPDPHKMKNRFFRGRVWIDSQTFQIVKVRGIVEPQGKQRFPFFATWREQVTDLLWLPARTTADDVLHFPNRDVHYRIRVRYYDYKLFTSKLTITEIDGPTR